MASERVFPLLENSFTGQQVNELTKTVKLFFKEERNLKANLYLQESILLYFNLFIRGPSKCSSQNMTSLNYTLLIFIFSSILTDSRRSFVHRGFNILKCFWRKRCPIVQTCLSNNSLQPVRTLYLGLQQTVQLIPEYNFICILQINEGNSHFLRCEFYTITFTGEFNPSSLYSLIA